MNFLMNELPQIRPVLFVQAGNVVSVDVGEVGFRHGSCTHVPSRFLPQSRAPQKFCNRDQNLRKRSGLEQDRSVSFIYRQVGIHPASTDMSLSDLAWRDLLSI